MFRKPIRRPADLIKDSIKPFGGTVSQMYHGMCFKNKPISIREEKEGMCANFPRRAQESPWMSWPSLGSAWISIKNSKIECETRKCRSFWVNIPTRSLSMSSKAASSEIDTMFRHNETAQECLRKIDISETETTITSSTCVHVSGNKRWFERIKNLWNLRELNWSYIAWND